MRWNPSTHPISDIRDWNNNNRLELRPDFQRKEVWSRAAQIMLIDSILINIPMPKIYLQAVIRNEDTYRIVIDGQQRLKAILSFLKDEYKLLKPYLGEYLGLCFSELPESAKNNFLLYNIDFNIISDADDKAIRELYSRVNKYNIPLNKQELRRADFPGDFLKLSEKLSLISFFDNAKVFTIANRRRLGDVEYISELLACLIGGPQDKKETLDQFYIEFGEVGKVVSEELEKKVLLIVNEINLLLPNISGTRFKQKADFYCLFLAINELHNGNNLIKDKDISYLQQDLLFLNSYIEPHSNIKLLSEYAIKCVSEANSLGSRTWRKDFLKSFLEGTYVNRIPSVTTREIYKKIKGDIKDIGIDCPICKVKLDPLSDDVLLTWKKNSNVFQFTNSECIHKLCIKNNNDYVIY
jgi:hypothetical protein